MGAHENSIWVPYASGPASQFYKCRKSGHIDIGHKKSAQSRGLFSHLAKPAGVKGGSLPTALFSRPCPVPGAVETRCHLSSLQHPHRVLVLRPGVGPGGEIPDPSQTHTQTEQVTRKAMGSWAQRY